MTTRDRTVVILIALVAILGAAWLLEVAPEREQANKLTAQIASAKAQLASAEGKEADARGAENQYAQAYASIVNLGKAVPPSEEVPSLIYQITQASNQKRVEFASISTSESGSGSSSSSATKGAPTGFTALPFTFVFEGGFFQLEHLMRQLADFTTLTAPGKVQVSGRLLTVQSIKLVPAAGAGLAGASNAGTLTGSITATAYVLPASEGLTGGASPAAPAAGSSPSSSAAASSPTTPAIVKATTP
jgi:hypothetical protein